MRSVKNVAILILSLSGGGTELGRMRIAEEFARRGLKVDLVCVNNDGSSPARAPAGVRLVNLKAPRVARSLFPLARYLRREKPRVMIAALNQLNVVPVWAKILSGGSSRIVLSIHTNIGLAIANSPHLREKVMPFLVRRFFPLADAVIAVSQGNAKDLSEFAGLPLKKIKVIKVIYDPVITQEIFEKANAAVDHPWFNPGNPPVVLGVAGRLNKAQDFPTLIRAFALVRQKLSARLMILGEGEERPNLEALLHDLALKDEVHLPGFVDNPYAYMKRSAVYVLSSRWQALPNAMIEAMALGTPVVSTDCPSGPREILEDGRLGRLVPVGDVEALAQAIVDTLSSTCDRERLKTRTEAFRLENVVDQYLEVIEQVCQCK